MVLQDKLKKFNIDWLLKGQIRNVLGFLEKEQEKAVYHAYLVSLFIEIKIQSLRDNFKTININNINKLDFNYE